MKRNHIRMSVIEVSHNLNKCRIYRRLRTFERYWILLHSHLIAMRIASPDDRHFQYVWEFRFDFSKFRSRTMFHYAVDVRHRAQMPGSTTTTSTTRISSPDINIEFNIDDADVSASVYCYFTQNNVWPGKRMAPLCAMPCVINFRDLFVAVCCCWCTSVCIAAHSTTTGSHSP